MTDTRQVLEEAFKVIFGREPDKVHIPEWNAWRDREIRFHSFLDAEAWTDAALCLVPEGWAWDVSTRPDGSGGVVYLHSPDRTKWRDRGGFADTPALAIAQAALRAKEAGDVCI